MKNILLFFFKVYKVLLPLIKTSEFSVEEDLYSISSTAGFNQIVSNDIGEKGTLSWYHMCFTSVSILLHSLILKYPQFISSLHLSISEAISLTRSEVWQVQLIAFSVIRSILHLDLYRLQKFQREKLIRATEQELDALSGSKKLSQNRLGNSIVGKSSLNMSAQISQSSTKKLKSNSAVSSNKLDRQASTLATSSTRLESKSAGNISRAVSQVSIDKTYNSRIYLILHIFCAFS